MKKRITAVFLACVMTVGVSAACGNSGAAPSGGVGSESGQAPAAAWKSESGFPIVLDPSQQPKITMFKSINDVEPENPNDNLWMQQAIADTGLQVEWITVPSSSAGERVQLMLANNELPDVFWDSIDRNHLLQYLDYGIFMPTEDLIDQYMPNLQKIYEARPEYKALSYAPDGHIYGFPRAEEMHGLVMTPGAVYVYKPWLDQLNIAMPATLDEWVDMLYKIKDAGDLNGNGVADEYALSWDFNQGWDHIFGWVSPCFGVMDVQTGPGNASNHLLLRDDKIVYSALDEGFQKTSELFHQFYVDGILNPDSFATRATGSSLHEQKLQQDLPMIGVFQSWGTDGMVPNPDVQAGYVSMPRVTGPNGKSGYIRNNSELFFTTLGMITQECENPDLVARFVDYCMQPEQSVTLNWGAIGCVYVKDSDGILRWDVDESGKIIKPKYELEWWQLRGYSTIGGPNVILSDYYDTVVEYPRDAQRLFDEQSAGGKAELLKEYKAVSPRVWFSTDDQARLDQILPQINSVYDATIQKWIIDGGADTEFEQFKKDLESAGLSAYLEIYQTAYDNYLKFMPE
ncbi:MAG: extracellular solute-binding protein [Clostridiales bacterium]|jgi:putative aldouronate transport system substrate-binding protein|nr:extracellular solute-binding protein [Clostridiales bacterium]